jgi:hypothetical protein
MRKQDTENKGGTHGTKSKDVHAIFWLKYWFLNR